MNVSITTKGFKPIRMTASDIGIFDFDYYLWNAKLDEESVREINYDDFRAFCDECLYAKHESEYYFVIPRELIDNLFAHEARCVCGLKGGEK